LLHGVEVVSDRIDRLGPKIEQVLKLSRNFDYFWIASGDASAKEILRRLGKKDSLGVLALEDRIRVLRPATRVASDLPGRLAAQLLATARFA
jgi:hypothetical protein